MKWARIKNNVAVEVINFNPRGKFHPSIIWIQVPDEVRQGWTTDGTTWTAPEIQEPVEPVIPEPEPKQLTVIEFKMCFTSPERIAIYALRDAGDPVLTDWLSILDDPRCTGVDLGLENTRSAVEYLVGKVTDFTETRADAVLNGEMI